MNKRYLIKKGIIVPFVFWFYGGERKLIEKNYLLTKDRFFNHPTSRFKFLAKDDDFMVKCGLLPEAIYLFDEWVYDENTFNRERWVMAVNRLTVKKVP